MLHLNPSETAPASAASAAHVLPRVEDQVRKSTVFCCSDKRQRLLCIHYQELEVAGRNSAENDWTIDYNDGLNIFDRRLTYLPAKLFICGRVHLL